MSCRPIDAYADATNGLKVIPSGDCVEFRAVTR
jgi:hypothetical protein